MFAVWFGIYGVPNVCFPNDHMFTTLCYSSPHKQYRVRFNLEGKFGKAFVFAEVSSDMPSGEFVYVLVQDKANGRVFTVVDNRSRLAAQRMAGGSKEGMEALSNLLGGGKK